MKSERTKCRNDEIPKLTRSIAARNKMHGRMNHARDGPALSEFPMNPTIAGCERVQAEVMLGSRRPQPEGQQCDIAHRVFEEVSHPQPVVRMCSPNQRSLRDRPFLSVSAREPRARQPPRDGAAHPQPCRSLSLIHISEPTRLGMISYAVFCLK